MGRWKWNVIDSSVVVSRFNQYFVTQQTIIAVRDRVRLHVDVMIRYCEDVKQNAT